MTQYVHHWARGSLLSFRLVAELSLCLMLAHGLPPMARAQTPAFLVKDINPMTGCIPYGSNPSSLTNVNGRLFFLADDGVHGEELWRSDGTEAGTALVRDINPGAGSGIRYLTPLNSTLFFVADDGTSGGEVWKSDGTEDGTVRLTHFNPGSYGLAPSELTEANGSLFFLRGTELWKSDDSELDTVQVKDIHPGGYLPSALTAADGMLFFVSGMELWKSDGSATGTMPVTAFDVDPGNLSLTAMNSTLFLFTPTMNSSQYGQDLRFWKSNGSAAGTVLLKTIERGSNWEVTADHFTPMNETLFFVAYSYLGYPPESPRAPVLWRSDGTADGTVPLASLSPDYSWDSQVFLTPFDGALFLTEYGRALMRADESASGSITLIKDLISQSPLVDVGGHLLFQACALSGGDCGLWESDGTAAGTRPLAEVLGGTPTVAGSFAFFSSQANSFGTELWAVPLTSLGRCGDGILDPGEVCDTAGESASCDVDCTAPECGDASVNRAAGEACDDGNTRDGDCCSATCMFEPAGSSCRDPSGCNEETCDGAGQCQSGAPEPAGTPCGNGNVCDGDEICDGSGMCQPGTVLLCDDGHPYTFDSCDPSSGCTNTPMGAEVGDCDYDGRVSVGELVMMVNIALGDEVDMCRAGDANVDQQITVDEILTAVNNNLNAPDPGGGLFDEL